MKFLKKLDLKAVQIFKILGLILGAGIVLIFLMNFVFAPLSDFMESGRYTSTPSKMQSFMAYEMDEAADFGEGYDGMQAESKMALGARGGGIAPPSPPGEPAPTTGDDAEDFEVTTYNTTIETRTLDETCQQFMDLKAKDYIIFENANEYDKGCNYTFKVVTKHTDEVLAVIEAMDPKNFSENTHTIKKVLEHYDSEADILIKKLESIEKTLEDAIKAYDDISVIATRNQDAESLAKIIDSKIRLIERLTQQRISTNERLDRIARAQAEQMDRLAYTFFNVTVTELKYVDFKSIKESWQRAIKNFVRDINTSIQDMTVYMVVFFFLIIQYAIYFFVLLFVAKYGWKWTRKIWKS